MFKKIGLHDDAYRYILINLDTGKEIKRCFMADDRIGIYGVYEEYVEGDEGLRKTYKRGNIMLVKERAWRYLQNVVYA